MLNQLFYNLKEKLHNLVLPNILNLCKIVLQNDLCDLNNIFPIFPIFPMFPMMFAKFEIFKMLSSFEKMIIIDGFICSCIFVKSYTSDNPSIVIKRCNNIYK